MKWEETLPIDYYCLTLPCVYILISKTLHYFPDGCEGLRLVRSWCGFVPLHLWLVWHFLAHCLCASIPCRVSKHMGASFQKEKKKTHMRFGHIKEKNEHVAVVKYMSRWLTWLNISNNFEGVFFWIFMILWDDYPSVFCCYGLECFTFRWPFFFVFQFSSYPLYEHKRKVPSMDCKLAGAGNALSMQWRIEGKK